jgi:FtsP/CotA-like multicopper oxidase with cupredoxin domain
MGALLVLVSAPSRAPDRPSPVITPIVTNDNRAPAGALRDGVLELRLEVRDGMWRPDGDADPGVAIRAFAEEGKPASIPGPLIRVPQGTEIHARVRNPLPDSTLILRGLSTRGAAGPEDTVQVGPGATRELRFTAGAPGTYFYWASTSPGGLAARLPGDAELSGAFIIDPPGAAGRTPDRVFVINLWNSLPRQNGVVVRNVPHRFTINGKAWPNTERLTYTVGDTVRFRVVNASDAVHPMHLHGFYFGIDSRGDGRGDTTYDKSEPPHRVVTERLAPGRTIAMHWIPERSGYWMFHCHDNFHVLRNTPLDGTGLPPEQTVHAKNHSMEMMGGLVMSIEVRPNGPGPVAEARARRTLRLTAQADTGGTETDPAYAYALGAGAGRLPGPTIVLRRGEPVSITVVNRLTEPTAVHWHGIELDSYSDGVADFSGHPGRIAAAIAPSDSFEARFTPPRSGTFMYHPHADEVRQQQAGLSGVLVVVDDPAAYDPAHDLVMLITAPRRTGDRGAAVLLNGSMSPEPLELRKGERYRFRVVNLHTFRASMIARLVRDSVPVTWRAVAKDGMDLPPARARSGPAVQQLSNGEAYDFEVIPTEVGELRFIVTTGGGQPLVSMEVRVR